jgi:hypothetical protein
MPTAIQDLARRHPRGASLKVAADQRAWPTQCLAVCLLAVRTLVILGLGWRTLTGIARGELKTLTL